jgi:hypothetical protein
MKKHLSIIVIIFIIISCGNLFKVEYYFPENSAGFYAVIFNSKNGITSQKSNGKYLYNFEQSNIILVKEAVVYGERRNSYYLINENKIIKRELELESDFVPKNNQTVVYFHTGGAYTNAETNKEINYEMFWLAPNKELSDKEQIEEDKRQNIQMQELHKKIDSLVNIGIL